MGSENEEPLELEAEHVFLLMKKEYRISRNTRAEWYFNHLNRTVFIRKAEKVEHFKGEIEIVSAVPQEPPIEWDWDTSHLYQYVITPSTVVMYLSHAYRLALCLDLSPSAATVDCIEGTTLLDDLLVSFKHCVQGLARPFIVPGSQLLFCPKIYITVIAHTPFLVSKGQQVLVAGWLLQHDNVNSLVEVIQHKLIEIETQMAFYTNSVEEQRDAQLADAERIVGGLFESMSDKTTSIPVTNVTMTTPEASFISILRYGMLALELLPEKSSSGIIVFTDGVFGSTDSGMLEVLLTQLRQNTISCSFVQVGSRSCHPASSEGFLPNNDLIDFFAAATFGVCINGAPQVDCGYEYRMNIYHQHFLTWGFHKSLLCSSQTHSLTWGFHKSLLCSNQTIRDSKNWSISNRCFESNYIHRISKKENEYSVNCSLNSVLSCRLKEGFTIKEIVLDDEAVEVRLALPWRPSITVEYVIRDQWPVNQASVRSEVNVQGPYDFLHDVTCRKIQSFSSRFRQMVVQSYWTLLKNLVETDQLLALFHSFSSNPSVYTVPEAIKSGVPLYYLLPNENSLVNTSNDAYPQFEAFWRPICILDLGSWQRWLHCHRISIILQHDRPLMKNLHLPTASGRYMGIQCRQASAALHAALRDFTSFVLLENHSYIGLVCTDSEKPVSFYLVRLTHKPPCVLIRIAFLGGTAGSIRQKVISELKLVIRSLTLPQRVLPQDNSTSAIPCCIVLQKPAERILIRYEKVPNDFLQATPRDPLCGLNYNSAAMRRQSPTPAPVVFKSPATQWSTLSHYLYHKRWIWSIQGTSGISLNLNAVARILATITNMRIQEGFSFAHSLSGIHTFLLEVEMKGLNIQPITYHNEDDPVEEQENCACVVQYVLFPPHPIGSYGVKDSLSEDEATEESDVQDNSDVQLEIVTECWVEPQTGMVSNSPHERRFFEGLDHISLADSFYLLDLDCISSLVTFEHLLLLCQSNEKPISSVMTDSRQSDSTTPYSAFRPDRSSGNSGMSSPHAPPLPVDSSFQSTATWERKRDEALKDDTVTCVPFCFQLPRLLPKCPKAKLLFSTFVQEFKLPAQYKASSADEVNELLFDLITQEILLLDHREVELCDGDCRLLLQNLDLEAAVDQKSNDSSHDADDNLVLGTPRDANSTPRTPRDVSSSAFSHRPSLFASSFNTSNELHQEHDGQLKAPTPKWRCFVKNDTQSRVIIIILPASFQDLKLLMLNDEHLQSTSSYLTRVAPDSSRQTLNHECSVDSKSVNDETAKITDDDQLTYCSQSGSQHGSQAPTRTNSFAGHRPRVASEAINQSARLRAGSLDTPCSHDHGHFHTCYSVGSADKRPISKLPSNPLTSPPRPGPSASSPVQTCTIFASLHLPIYIYDCQQSNLLAQIQLKSSNDRVNILRDHTFKNEESRGGEDDSQDGNDSQKDDDDVVVPVEKLSRYCDAIEALYCKCLGQALFVSLQQDKMIHSRDVEAAMNLCRETLLEIDITAFIQNICGHLKDFNMKTLLETLKLKKQNDQETHEDENAHWNFPLSLLKLHQPCSTLRHLHKLIRTRFQEILCLSFKPVPSLFDYYFYYPPDLPNTPMTSAPQDLALNLDESEVVQFHCSFETDNATSRSCSPPGGRSEEGSEPLDDVEIEGDGESEYELPAVPLFLHLTATVRVKKEVMSQSLNGLPTCLGDLMGCLPCFLPVVDLKSMKVTLDFLCLTFRSDIAELFQAAQSMRTTSFCSSSSGILEANACPTLVSQSELSDDDPNLSMDDDERTESISRQLLHLPEGQRGHVKAAIGEIEWMLKDEIVAFLLDTFPITEGTLSTVVQHVQLSAHRPSCRRKVVPLIFVLNPEESYRRFLTEFHKMSIHGHRLWEEGSYYYVTEKGMMKKLVDSLEPSLGVNFRSAIEEGSEKSRSLVAQTSIESSAGSVDPRAATPVNKDAEDGEEPISPVSGTWKSAEAEAATGQSADGTVEAALESQPVEQSADQSQCEILVQVESPVEKSEKKRFESGTTSIFGRHSDSSSIVDSVRNTEDGYDGGSSDSEDECEWLRGLGIDKPKMPPFWLVLRVKQDAVTSYFHCRWELTPPEELLQWKQIHENLLECISALGKLINQQMLLKDLHDTRLCNQLLEPETSEDLWNDTSQSGTPSHHTSRANNDSFYRFHLDQHEQPICLEASLKLKPGTFECRQVWEAHFPLHPRLKTGPGKLNTSKGVQQLMIVLNAFSVNNRSNMFVYQEDSGNVFYLRLHESSCVGHKSNSDSVSVSRSNPDEMEIQGISISRRSSNWNVSDKGVGEDGIESNRRSGSFSERDSLAGDQTSLSGMPLNRQPLWQSQQQLARREDCILLKVHGITEAGPSIKEDLVRVLQNKLDDAVLEVLHSLLSRNTACKLTSDDVHFIQKPHDMPHRVFQCPVQTCVLPYLAAMAFYLRQNLLECVLYPPKYMDNYAGNHFQDYSIISPAPNSDVYLYNRPQAAGNRGIACIAFTIVDGRGNAVPQMNWPRPAGRTDPADILSISNFESFIQTNLYDVDKDVTTNKKRPGPMALLEFRIWERGHINAETLKSKLEASIRHALWDVVLEYRLLPFPFCMTSDEGSEVSPGQIDGLPSSEPTTPVRRKWQLVQPIVHEEDSFGDPRSRSVSFSGLPPNRNPAIASVVGAGTSSGLTSSDSKWKVRHTSGSHPPSRERPHSPISSAQLRSLNPASPVERGVYERSQSASSMMSSSLTTAPPNVDKFESGERGVLHPVYSSMIEKWFNTGSLSHAPSIKQLKATLLAPLTVPLFLKAFEHICKSVTNELPIKIFASADGGATFAPCTAASLCPKNSTPDRGILNTSYILMARNFFQWKESLCGEINATDVSRVALKMQQNHQRFISYLHDAGCAPCPEALKVYQQAGDQEKDTCLLIPRQRLLWVTVNRQSELVMWMYNFNKDGHEALSKQCTALVQWHNARWALLSSILAQKSGLFHNQPVSPRTNCHSTLQNNPFLSPGEMDSLAKSWVPPTSRDYNSSNPPRKPASQLPHLSQLEAYRDAKSVRLLSQTTHGQSGDIVQRHGTQWLEKRHLERREEFQKLFALWPPRSTGTTVSVTEDVIVLFKQVARTIHYCFTPLLFLPKWRLQVARTRDPNMATVPSAGQITELTKFRARNESGNSMNSGSKSSPTSSPPRKLGRPTDDHWHQSICSAYLQEYVQYLHTLGFLELDIKPLAAKRGPKSALKTQRMAGEDERVRRFSGHPGRAGLGNTSSPSPLSSETNVLYFHKSHQGGIIICEVAVQEPFFYNKVYALEASRLISSSTSGLPNIAHIHSTQAHYTDRFLNECDHIKVLLHLHSFTYDFHIRCLNSYVSGRQLQLKPAFHLVSFLDDFTKYYSKAPNFARNQVVTHTLSIKDSATPGESLYEYVLNHEQRYGLKVFRMISSTSTNDNDEVTTEYVLAKQWPFRNLQRDIGDYKQTDDYDVTLLVAQDPVAEDPMTLYIRYYVILTSKREYYPRLVIEKKPGKFRTVSTVTPPFQQKAASAPPLELADSDPAFPPPEPSPIAEQSAMHKSSSDLPVGIDKAGKSPSTELLSASNPEVSYSQRKDSANLVIVPEESRTSPAAAAAAAAAAAVAAVKHPNMRSPMFIRQEVINYLGYYTKHEQDMQSMMNEQAKKAEDLIRATINQAKVHCRRDTLWRRLQDPASTANNLTFNEFRELLTLSFAEPVSSTEVQLVSLLSQPVTWYQGLAKLLLSRYPENHRYFSSLDAKIQYIVILNHRLIGTAMMLFWDSQADKAELSSLCQEVPVGEPPNSGMPAAMDSTGNQRQYLTQIFVEEIVNFCAFHMWSNLLG